VREERCGRDKKGEAGARSRLLKKQGRERGTSDRVNLASTARGVTSGHLQHSRGWLDGREIDGI
jgi:hypothetical protein